MTRFLVVLCLLAGVSCSSPTGPSARGLVDRRGLIHAHSVYSHDACDGEPEVDGVRNEPCFEDFRRDLCTAKHDFVMLTDHRDLFASTEFPDILLYSEKHGDELVVRNELPVASWAGCPDKRRSLIMAGTESGTLSVGIESHVEGRGDVYGQSTPDAIAKLKANGAVVLMAHTEEWTPEELIEKDLDGFEMFNIHANIFKNFDKALLLLSRLLDEDEGLPKSDLVLLGMMSEDPAYLTRWGTVLARGARRVTTMGTDCHRNSFPQMMPDGERVDSYRRLMMWFSNHLLVKPDADGRWDDRHLKEALRSGRLYGAFEVMGEPEGFDYRVETAAGVGEMGAEVLLSDAPTLKVTRPSVRNLNSKRKPPVYVVRVLKAIEGGFEEVASGASDIEFKPTTAGAYRAEVRLVPHHLREDLGDDADEILDTDHVWIYSNAIYVRQGK